MISKKQIDSAIQKSKLDPTSLLSLKWKDEEQLFGGFSRKNKGLNKKVDGYFSVIGDDIKAVINYSNYSKNYIGSKLRNEFVNLGFENSRLSFEYNVPQVGSIITTKEHIDRLQNGDEVAFDVGTYYFSTSNDPGDDVYIDCNGWRLRNAFKAVFINQFNSRCDGTGFSELPYTKFQLVDNLG